MAKRRTHHAVTVRRFRFSKRMDETAKTLLQHAEQLLEESGGLDTVMREVIHDGLSRIVYVAYDTMAMNKDPEEFKQNCEEQSTWIERQTEKWFVNKGFAGWYAAGAGCCFNREPPRVRALSPHRIIRVYPKKKKVAA